jgi:hypothetical protein
MFTLEVKMPGGWKKLNDYYVRPESASSAARRLAQKERRSVRVVVFSLDEEPLYSRVLETIAYTPPAPKPAANITALTKEIFG